MMLLKCSTKPDKSAFIDSPTGMEDMASVSYEQAICFIS